MTHGKTYNKSPRRINNKATKSKTNTGTTALERSVEQTTVGFKALLQLANFTLGPDATLNTEIHKNSVRIKASNSVNASKRTFICNLELHQNKEWSYAQVNGLNPQFSFPTGRSEAVPLLQFLYVCSSMEPNAAFVLSLFLSSPTVIRLPLYLKFSITKTCCKG